MQMMTARVWQNFKKAPVTPIPLPGVQVGTVTCLQPTADDEGEDRGSPQPACITQPTCPVASPLTVLL